MRTILPYLKSRLQLGRDQFRRALGRVLFDKPRIAPLPIPHLQRIVLVRWDAKLGDAIVSSWIFRELKKQYPAASIEVITSPAMAWLFKEHFGADIVYECPKRTNYRQLAHLAKQIGQIDLLVHFGQQLKMKDIFFIRMIASQYVAGLDDELACINIKLGQKTSGLHFCHKFAELVKVCGVSSPQTDYLLPYSPASQKAITPYWPANPVIAINPFGSGQSRRLSTESIQRLLHALDNTLPSDVRFCLLFSPDNKQKIIQLCSQLPRTFCYPESTTISDVVAQIKKAKGLISVDTATIHIAAGLNTPILGLYNPDPINFAEWGPNTKTSRVVFAEKRQPEDINALPWAELPQQILTWWQEIESNGLT
ncbi:glycosyltransferase family 9 protein [Tolumonas lignilytica]|uniref:glycosyltransferase family 9 protein n=1 Tax=Tolumonas lignilytica TaxID=1283284 RepID=UPI0004631BB6|nr:glycosyltransferase family 9 protein [Tolumonas lignilytica]